MNKKKQLSHTHSKCTWYEKVSFGYQITHHLHTTFDKVKIV